MEKQLNYVLRPSLQQMCLRRIAVSLYSDPHVLDLIVELKFRPNSIEDIMMHRLLFIPFKSKLLKTVVDKLSKLQLPSSLTKQMFPLIKAVGSEVMAWRTIHGKYLSKSISWQRKCLQKLRWTSAGTVDYKKTAEELVRCDALDIVERFDLCCLYCLEDFIPPLWEELSNENKKSLFGEEMSSRVETPPLNLFMPYIHKKQFKINPAMFGSTFFEEAALCGNRTLAGYCFSNLTEEEREASLVRTTKKVIRFRAAVTYSDFTGGRLSIVACYLLSLMTPEKQMGIFLELPCEVVRCFMDWTCQDLLPAVADVIWTFLPQSKYADLLNTIDKHFSTSVYYFPNVFQNLFLSSPREFRKHFVEEAIKEGSLFLDFFTHGDTETIEVVLRNVDAADRIRIASSESCLLLFCMQEEHGRWHVVEAFLRAATLSEEDKVRLKESFIHIAILRVGMRQTREEQRYPILIELIRKEYSKFFEFVERTNASTKNKRSLEDEALTEAKRFCIKKEENSTW